MSMYKKLDCTCGHEYARHELAWGSKAELCVQGLCLCLEYDPAGHNPELENILCPRCRLVRLEKTDRHYICVACSYVMLESQVLEITG